MTIGPDGLPHSDFSRCTYDQMAAIKAIKIEEFVDKGSLYHDETLGKMMPREVRRVTFTMRDNVPSAALVARMFKWIEEAPKSEPPRPLEQRLRAMTPEQRRQDAKELYDRIRKRLKELPPSAVEPEGEELEPTVEGIRGRTGGHCPWLPARHSLPVNSEGAGCAPQ